MIKALLFDVDGTLVSIPQHTHRDIIIPYMLRFGKFTTEQYFDALNAARRAYKTSRSSGITGKYMLFLLQGVSRRLRLHIPEKKLEKLYGDLWKVDIEKVLLLDDSRRALPILKKRFKLYIVTGRHSSHARTLLKKFRIRRHFAAIYTPDRHRALKESGKLFGIFLRTTGLKPEECLMIGDRPDVDGTSMDKGMFFCLVDRDNKYRGARYDFRIRNLRELEGVLKKLAVIK